MLEDCFPVWDIEERQYRWAFSSLHELLLNIKYTGTRGGASGQRLSWSPGLFARVERAYRARHGGIHATYQVFLCQGRK